MATSHQTETQSKAHCICLCLFVPKEGNLWILKTWGQHTENLESFSSTEVWSGQQQKMISVDIR